MSKAILVIDMPANCIHCPCLHMYDGDDWCAVACKVVYNPSNRDKCCPLKWLPEKIDIEAERNEPHDIDCDWEFESGYNACIEEILGE